MRLFWTRRGCSRVSVERWAYALKHRFPALFAGVAAVARGVTVLRHGRRIRRALVGAAVHGFVADQPAVMRALDIADAETLSGFLTEQSEEHLRYFHPHDFGTEALRQVLASGAYMNYGLFVEDSLAGYALLKVAPTGSAFIGLLVDPRFTGLGLGRFMTSYLYWQASLAGLRARSTISRHNPASLRSHEAAAEYTVVAELPNDYLMIEFPPGNPEPPVLEVGVS